MKKQQKQQINSSKSYKRDWSRILKARKNPRRKSQESALASQKAHQEDTAGGDQSKGGITDHPAKPVSGQSGQITDSPAKPIPGQSTGAITDYPAKPITDQSTGKITDHPSKLVTDQSIQKNSQLLKQSAKNPKGSSKPSVSVLSWAILFLNCCLFGVIWAWRLNEFQIYTEEIKQSFHPFTNEVVLGIDDEHQQKPSGPAALDISADGANEQDIDTIQNEDGGQGRGADSADLDQSSGEISSETPNVGESDVGESEEIAYNSDSASDSNESSSNDSNSTDEGGGDNEGNDIVAQNSQEPSGSVDLLVDDIENERKQELRDILKLQLPYEIDNPNYPVTFVPPKGDQIQIQVDGDGFKSVESPFILPSLSIGQHKLNFKFEDKDDITQNFTEIIIIIPRPPQLEEGHENKFRSDQRLTFNGTALPNSEVVVIVGSNLITARAEVNSDGKWQVDIEKGKLETGEHTIVAMTRKLGYSSNFSKSFSFTVGKGSGNVSTDDIDFDNGRQFSLENYINEENYMYVLGGVGGFTLILLVVIAVLGRKLSQKRNFDKGLKGALQKATSKESSRGSNPQNDNAGVNGAQTLSLREKIAIAKSQRKTSKSNTSSSNTSSQSKDTQKEDVTTTSDNNQSISGNVDSQTTNVEDVSKDDPESSKEQTTEKALQNKTEQRNTTQKAGTQRASVPNAGKQISDENKSEMMQNSVEGDSQKVQESKTTKQSEKEEPDQTSRDQKSREHKGESHKSKEQKSEQAANKDSHKIDKKDSKHDSKGTKTKRNKPVPGKIYKKSDFLEKFKPEDVSDSNKINITLTSNNKGKEIE